MMPSFLNRVVSNAMDSVLELLPAFESWEVAFYARAQKEIDGSFKSSKKSIVSRKIFMAATVKKLSDLEGGL